MASSEAIVLLSGGLDSVVNFQKAIEDTGVRMVLFFHYGQKALHCEREAVRGIAYRYDVMFRELKLDFMRCFSSGLTTGRIPHLKVSELEDKQTIEKTAHSVWVPNRNGIFLEIAAGIAENDGVSSIVVGFNREEAATFPDNSRDYMDCLNMALKYSTRNHVRVVSYTLLMKKSEIYQLGKEIGAPLDRVWSCYRGGNMMCGECESCQRLKRAIGEDRERFDKQHFRGGFKR